MAPRPKARELLEERRAEVEAWLTKEGVTIREAAERLGVSATAVQNATDRWGIAAGKPGPRQRSPLEERLRGRVEELETQHAAMRELARSIRDASATLRPMAPPAPRLLHARRGAPTRETPVDVVFHVSDLQYGMRVGQEVPGGSYSPEVFEDERLPRWIAGSVALLELVAMAHPIRCVWFAQGGDYVEGDRVFKAQEWHLALDAGEQIARLAPVWASAMAEVAVVAKRLGAGYVYAVNVGGNHGVQGGRGAGAVPASLNFDFILYEMVRHILEGMPGAGGLDFYQRKARHAVYFDAAGSVFLLSHGDQDRGGGIVGFAAVNGVRNDVMVRLQTGISHRYHLKGHWHKGATIPPGGDAEILWNGSWEGPTNLSIARGGGAEPMQRAHVIHPDYGRFIEWPIRLAPGLSKTNPPQIIAAPEAA